jgi:importin subunit beta-1
MSPKIRWLMLDSDLSEAFPHGEISQYYRAEWVTRLIKEGRSNRDFSPRTIETAKWAREQVKRQIAAGQHQGTVMKP